MSDPASSTQLVHRRDGSVDVWTSPEVGSLYLWRIAPSVVGSRIEGYLTVEMARAFVGYIEQAFGEGEHVTGLHDWSEVTGYATEARRLITRFTDSNKKKFKRIVIYTRSRLVRMGIATSNLVLGSIVEAVGTRAAIDALIAEASGPKR